MSAVLDGRRELSRKQQVLGSHLEDRPGLPEKPPSDVQAKGQRTSWSRQSPVCLSRLHLGYPGNPESLRACLQRLLENLPIVSQIGPKELPCFGKREFQRAWAVWPNHLSCAPPPNGTAPLGQLAISTSTPRTESRTGNRRRPQDMMHDPAGPATGIPEQTPEQDPNPLLWAILEKLSVCLCQDVWDDMAPGDPGRQP